MGLTENLVEIKSEAEALVTYANTITGNSDTTLSDAIATLVDGYGKGGGVSIYRDFVVGGTLRWDSKNPIVINTGFEPIIVIIKLLDPTIADVAHVYSFMWAKNMVMSMSSRNASNPVIQNGGIVDLSDGSTGNATGSVAYSGGITSIIFTPASRLPLNGREYEIIIIG